MKISTFAFMLLLAAALCSLTGCPQTAQQTVQEDPAPLPVADEREDQEVRTPINNEPQEIGERVDAEEEMDDTLISQNHEEALQRLRDSEPFEIPGMTFWDISSP